MLRANTFRKQSSTSIRAHEHFPTTTTMMMMMMVTPMSTTTTTMMMMNH